MIADQLQAIVSSQTAAHAASTHVASICQASDAIIPSQHSSDPPMAKHIQSRSHALHAIHSGLHSLAWASRRQSAHAIEELVVLSEAESVATVVPPVSAGSLVVAVVEPTLAPPSEGSVVEIDPPPTGVQKFCTHS